MPTDPIETELLTITTDTPPNIDEGWSQDGIVHDTPSRSEDGHASGIRFALSFTYGPYAPNTLYSGQPAFTDNVFGLGWNLDSSFTPIDTTMGGPSIRIESRFQKPTRNPATPGGYIDGSEYHVAQHTAGGTGVGQEYRPISAWAPFHNEDWPYDADVSFQAAVYSFADGNRNPHVTFAWNGDATATKGIELSSQVRINRLGNNQPWMTQTNAAGTSQINLPYVNSGNGYTFDRDIYMSAANVGLNPLGIQSLLSLVGTSGFTDGARMIYLNTNAVTGSLTGSKPRFRPARGSRASRSATPTPPARAGFGYRVTASAISTCSTKRTSSAGACGSRPTAISRSVKACRGPISPTRS